MSQPSRGNKPLPKDEMGSDDIRKRYFCYPPYPSYYPECLPIYYESPVTTRTQGLNTPPQAPKGQTSFASTSSSTATPSIKPAGVPSAHGPAAQPLAKTTAGGSKHAQSVVMKTAPRQDKDLPSSPKYGAHELEKIGSQQGPTTVSTVASRASNAPTTVPHQHTVTLTTPKNASAVQPVDRTFAATKQSAPSPVRPTQEIVDEIKRLANEMKKYMKDERRHRHEIQMNNLDCLVNIEASNASNSTRYLTHITPVMEQINDELAQLTREVKGKTFVDSSSVDDLWNAFEVIFEDMHDMYKHTIVDMHTEYKHNVKAMREEMKEAFDAHTKEILSLVASALPGAAPSKDSPPSSSQKPEERGLSYEYMYSAGRAPSSEDNGSVPSNAEKNQAQPSSSSNDDSKKESSFSKETFDHLAWEKLDMADLAIGGMKESSSFSSVDGDLSSPPRKDGDAFDSKDNGWSVVGSCSSDGDDDEDRVF
ncbi:hypothetical protein F4677DRAFT_281165 [Hypoxylon crocopeplum]|nr:hypothetical protein F4677DRAFT_281165 [Hypoxylon crocopeplum]